MRSKESQNPWSYFCPGTLIVIILASFEYRFPLLGKKTIFSGDAPFIGLPFLQFRSQVLRDHASMLWNSSLYGGHPLFAEGQAAFLSPLSLIFSVVPGSLGASIYALNLFPVICLVLSGIGMIGLCRSLGLGRSAAAFAALATVFSLGWSRSQEIEVLGGAFLWVPWCLWAAEIWFARPSVRSGTVMGTGFACLIFAGYPQIFHGTVIYLAVRLAGSMLTPDDRETWRRLLRRRLSTGALGVAICGGLAAAQLLPLLELIPLSHRHGGTDLFLQPEWGAFARGLLFSWNDPAGHVVIYSVGSLFVCAAASLSLVYGRSSAILSHLSAGAFLIILGVGLGSPIFAFIYSYHLIPGLHFFRVVIHYLPIGTIGISIAAAGAIDGLMRRPVEQGGPLVRTSHFWVLGTAALVWIGLGYHYAKDVQWPQFAVPAAALLGVLAFVRFGTFRLTGVLLTGLLAIEFLAVRSYPLRQVATDTIAEPASVRAIKGEPGWQDYKVYDLSSVGFMFQSAWDPAAAGRVKLWLANLQPMTPSLWGLSSIDGPLALQLARRRLIDPVLQDEVLSGKGPPPGARLIDLLAIRFISADAPPKAQALRVLSDDPAEGLVVENLAAAARFQVFQEASFVDTPEAALSAIEQSNRPRLVIEAGGTPEDGGDRAPDARPNETDTPAAIYSVKQSSDARYALDIDARRPCWMFLADANYPGWAAFVDGRPRTVYTANILGKAVRVPAGHHALRLEFRPKSFAIGSSISASTLLLIALLVLPSRGRAIPKPQWLPFRPRHTKGPDRAP